MSRYMVAVRFMQHVELEVPDPPPCLFCGVIGFGASMSGPLVCGRCDCGNGANGRKTQAEFDAGRAHRLAYIEKYKVT